MKPWEVIVGDCIVEMRGMEPESYDAIVCDPPYFLSFMGSDFDSPSGIKRSLKDAGIEVSKATSPPLLFQLWCQAWATEALRVLKPGGYIAAFGGDRTHHRLMSGIEDAGFDIVHTISYCFASGFPKSLNISKKMDQAAGATREIVGSYRGASGIGKKSEGKMGYSPGQDMMKDVDMTVYITKPSTDVAKQWDGWGTQLKPAWEAIVLARKPMIGTFIENVERYGVGAMNIDGCRIATTDVLKPSGVVPSRSEGSVGDNFGFTHSDGDKQRQASEESIRRTMELGRWPANMVFQHDDDCELVGTKRIKVHAEATGTTHSDTSFFGGSRMEEREIHTYSDADGMEIIEEWHCVEGCPVLELDRQSGAVRSSGRYQAGDSTPNKPLIAFGGYGPQKGKNQYTDRGGASRMFFTSKASRSEREDGLTKDEVTLMYKFASGEEDIVPTPMAPDLNADAAWNKDGQGNPYNRGVVPLVNNHPTLKSLALMRWLCRLVTPPAGRILDCFMGSGSTGIAACKEGFRFVGIEREAPYAAIAKKRIAHALGEDLPMFRLMEDQ